MPSGAQRGVKCTAKASGGASLMGRQFAASFTKARAFFLISFVQAKNDAHWPSHRTPFQMPCCSRSEYIAANGRGFRLRKLRPNDWRWSDWNERGSNGNAWQKSGGANRNA